MLGDKIEARRKILGISQKELAQRAGITEASLSRYINNARLPKTEYLKKIADALHTTTDFLLGKDDPTDFSEEFPKIRTILARNASKMTNQQKRELINALLADENEDGNSETF